MNCFRQAGWFFRSKHTSEDAKRPSPRLQWLIGGGSLRISRLVLFGFAASLRPSGSTTRATFLYEALATWPGALVLVNVLLTLTDL